MSTIYKLLPIAVLLLCPTTSYAVSLDPTGSIDSAVYSSGTLGSVYTKFSTTFNGTGFQYRPGAGHNICTVSISAASSATSTLPSLTLNVYSQGMSPATSTSQWIDSGTFVRGADSSIQIPSSLTAETFTFTPCLPVQGGRYYNFTFTTSATGSSGINVYLEGQNSNQALTLAYTGTGQFIFPGEQLLTHAGSAVWTDNYNTCNSGINYRCIQFVLNGTENYSNFTASSTTSYSSPNCTPPTSILDVGGGVSYALCFMFVPNQTLIDQYANLSDVISNKFPFTYISGLQDISDAISGESASSTPNASFTFPLGATFTNPSGGATTTAFTMFAPATILADVPLLGTMRTYMGYIIYFMFGIFAFKRVMKII